MTAEYSVRPYQNVLITTSDVLVIQAAVEAVVTVTSSQEAGGTNFPPESLRK